MAAALLTAFLVGFSACLGFIHFKQSLVFLALLFFSCTMSASFLFLKGGLWVPIAGPLLTSFCGYIGSQAMLSWHLYNEWNVRSLSIKPLLTITQKADADLDKGGDFDDYLRSLWRDIEDKTGVTLKFTRVNESLSMVRNYLLRAQETAQQSGESFYIIKNASDTSPRHRMLLPLPAWQDRERKTAPREYVILAWNGNIPTETLTSLAALTLFAAVHFHAQEEGRRRKEMLFKTIEAIMMAVEAKDSTTSEHSRRVATLSKNLAQWMNLSPQEVEDIYFSAIIHDIGKLGISDNVLKKPAMLTEEELAEMHRHPSIGEDIMRPVDLPSYIISGITQHHERHDGKGYPTGIKGDHMTTAGKIIKVADVYDALANRRQYKEPWTLEQVRDFFLERRGTEFDPQVVDVFLQHIHLLKEMGLSSSV
jgi:HD-GYP domain-containing protein (c-di-GMP phosphodiesterase class II)